MLGVKNLRVVAAGLCLGVTLTSCGGSNNTITIGDSKIVYNYENNQITGNITFDSLNKYGKVVVLEDNGETFYRLLLKEFESYAGIDYSYDHFKYVDLETGAALIEYKVYSNNDEIDWEAGSNLNILLETGITSYLVNNDFVKLDYTVEELITFFRDNVMSSLDLNEKELVK